MAFPYTEPVTEADQLTRYNLIQVVAGTTTNGFDAFGIGSIPAEQLDSIELRFPSGRRLIISLADGEEEIAVEDLSTGDLILVDGREIVLQAQRG